MSAVLSGSRATKDFATATNSRSAPATRNHSTTRLPVQWVCPADQRAAEGWMSGDAEMPQLVGVPDDVDGRDEPIHDLEGVRLNQSAGSAHHQPGKSVDRVDEDAHVVRPPLPGRTGQECRDALGALDDVERGRHLAAAV